MQSSSNVKEEVRRRLDIVEIIGEYVPLTRKADRYWAPCPFHVEKTPSFCVVPDKEMFFCFGCRKGGDLFAFIMEIEKMDFSEALRFLADRAGVELQKRENSKREALLELYQRVTETFHHLLTKKPEGRSAREYLESRSVRDTTIERYKLGYAPANPNWLAGFLRTKGYSEEFLGVSGLFTQRRGEIMPLFRARIMFPIRDAKGRVTAFGGRLMTGDGPKYINSPETEIFVKGENLFGISTAIPEIRTGAKCIVVEGYTDVLSMNQAGFPGCVAPLGTALTESQLRILKRYTDKIFLLFDGDKAGSMAARRSLNVLEEIGLEAEVVVLPDGQDPADIVAGSGQEAIEEYLSRSQKGFDYLLNWTQSIHDKTTPAGKQEILQNLLPFLSSVGSDVKREGYLAVIADLLGVELQSVRNDYRRRRETRRRQPVEEPGKLKISIELYLMIAVLLNIDYFSEIRNILSLEDFTDPTARQVFILMEEGYRTGTKGLSNILDQIENGNLKELLVEKAATEEFSQNPRRIIYDTVMKIQYRNLVNKRDDLLSSLKIVEKQEPWRMNELLVDKMVLDRKIEDLKVTGNVGSSE